MHLLLILTLLLTIPAPSKTQEFVSSIKYLPLELSISILCKKYILPSNVNSKKLITLHTQYSQITFPISKHNIMCGYKKLVGYCLSNIIVLSAHFLTQKINKNSKNIATSETIEIIETLEAIKKKKLILYSIPLYVINSVGLDASMEWGERLAKRYGVINVAEKYLGTLGKIATIKLSRTIGSLFWSTATGTAQTCFNENWNLQKPSLPKINFKIHVDYKSKKTWLETIAASLDLIIVT